MTSEGWTSCVCSWTPEVWACSSRWFTSLPVWRFKGSFLHGSSEVSRGEKFGWNGQKQSRLSCFEDGSCENEGLYVLQNDASCSCCARSWDWSTVLSELVEELAVCWSVLWPFCSWEDAESRVLGVEAVSSELASGRQELLTWWGWCSSESCDGKALDSRSLKCEKCNWSC